MKARTRKTSKGPCMMSPFLFRPDPEGESLDPFHEAALSLGQGDGGVAARAPGRPPELGLARPPRRDIIEDHRHLPDQAVHRLAPVELEMAHEGPPEQEKPHHRNRREEQPLQPGRARPPRPRQPAPENGPDPEPHPPQ